MAFDRMRPAPPLDAFIDCFWIARGDAPRRGRERLLPTGGMDLIFNLNDAPLHGFADATPDARGWRVHGAIVHGPQSRWFVVGERGGPETVGVHFRPGGASALLGLPASELQDLHVGLDEVWGAQAWKLRDRLIAAAHPRKVFTVLQNELVAVWLSARRPLLLHPAVAHALRALDAEPLGLRIAAARDATGYGHKRFAALFRDAVGLTPKLFQRIRRFDLLLDRALGEPDLDWAELAADGGFTDQAHLHRDFIDFTGLTPGAWRRTPKREALHVPVDAST